MEKEGTNKLVGRLINELSRAAHSYFQAEFKKHSIGHAQIRTLLFIERNEGLSQMKLAESLKLDKSTLTSQLSLLEKNGYILRSKAEEDARMYQIRSTAKTKKIVAPLKSSFSAWTKTLLEGFSEEESETLYNFLERMNCNAQKQLDRSKERG
jgi:DNA-binding MarR family transcriptional regulator